MKLSLSLVFALAIAACGCNPKDTPDASAAFKEVDALVAKNEIDPAIALLQNLHAKDESDPKVAARLAELYAQKGDYSKAVIAYKAIIEKHPDLALAHVPLGQIYMSLRDYPRAKESFTKARELGVGDNLVALPLGVSLGQLGDLESADKEFERALKAGESEKVVRYNQALLRSEKKQFKEAKDLLEGILAADPQNAAAKRELAHVLQSMVLTQPDPVLLKRSMDLLWEVKDELKDDPRTYEFMGDGWLLVGDYDACLAAYTEALRLGQNPKSVQDKYVLAKQRQTAANKDKQPAAPDASGKQAPKK